MGKTLVQAQACDQQIRVRGDKAGWPAGMRPGICSTDRLWSAAAEPDVLPRTGEAGAIADTDADLDRAEYHLRSHESRWPVLASLLLIAALSAGLWLGIYTFALHVMRAA